MPAASMSIYATREFKSAHAFGPGIDAGAARWLAQVDCAIATP
jgi:hypothetical protein